MIRTLSFIIACFGAATCIISSLAFLPLVMMSPLSLDAAEQITAHTMTAGLALSALGAFGLVATEAASALRAA